MVFYQLFFIIINSFFSYTDIDKSVDKQEGGFYNKIMFIAFVLGFGSWLLLFGRRIGNLVISSNT